MATPLETYQQLLLKLKEDLTQLNKRRSLFGWLRLSSMGFAFLTLWLAWSNGWYILFPLPVLLIGFFLFILSRDFENNDAIKNLERLRQINETEIQVLHHQFTHLPDGNEFKPHAHDYANDLDIFGRASLYQYINRTTSEQGNKLLADCLLNPSSPGTILQRQEAIKELSQLTEWRQQLQSYGMANPISVSTQQKTEDWLEQPLQFINKIHWQVLRFLLPLISITLLVLHIIDIIPANIFYPLITLMLIISLAISRLVTPAWMQLDKIAPQLETLSSSISWVEKTEFKSLVLANLKIKYSQHAVSSSGTIKKLKKILDRFDIRLNPLVFLPLNTFLSWDLQQAFALENWKKENKEHIGDWFQSLAEIESLSTLSNLAFNHPHWAFPVITEQKGVFIASSLGHPLIPEEKCVHSSFSTEGLNQLNLVTGSNMAGKSTFLRSVGVNIVLAMTGSPVCAASLTLSHMKVISSMRVNDNLEESTSTFYAELKKLKEIIEAVYQNKETFLLLDEILRGTNSADRHTGSKALIKQLVAHNAAGLIATHDLELAKLADEFPGKIHNYHFDVQVANDELFFDYKLKRGISQSMNASILMKKIGIEL